MRLKDNRPPSPIKITRPKNTPPALRPLSGRPARRRLTAALMEAMRTARLRLLRYKHELEVVDDPVHGQIIGYEGTDLHLTAAFRTDHRVDLVKFPDHGRPALGPLHSIFD